MKGNMDFLKLVHEAFNEHTLQYFIDDSKSVFHYTSPEGFINIVTNQELWFGNIKNVNDITEIDYAFRKIIYPCVRKFKFKDNTLNNRIIALMSPLRNREFSFPHTNEIKFKKASIFVLCTSLKEDSTMLWELYCKNSNKEGYSIALDKDRLVDSIISCCQTNEKGNAKSIHYIFQGRVVYDEKKQKEIVNDYLGVLEYNLEKQSTEDIKQEILNIYVQKFLIMAMFMKDDDFDKEQEYRFVVVADDEALDCNLEKKPYLLFNSNNGSIISRLVFPFHKNIIQRVSISPYVTGFKSKEFARYFLDKNSLTDVEIIQGTPKMRR